jgi:hypothetical protein
MRRAATLIALAAVACAGERPASESSAPSVEQRPAVQESFGSAEEAAEALVAAVREHDRDRLWAIFGPELDQLASGEERQDNIDFQLFTAAYDRKHELVPAGPDAATLTVGEWGYAFPAPIVQRDGRWVFDTAAGLDEILDRRIGNNELETLKTCLIYVRAQERYFALDADGDGKKSYARRLRSSEGQRDGLYWPDAEGPPRSPLGPLVAAARARSDKDGQEALAPYYGYLYRVLTRQGPGAPGGEKDYVSADGQMTEGFALLAWPAEYGGTGIMSFLVGKDGVVHERDLGEQTESAALALPAYDPAEGWSVVVR